MRTAGVCPGAAGNQSGSRIGDDVSANFRSSRPSRTRSTPPAFAAASRTASISSRASFRISLTSFITELGFCNTARRTTHGTTGDWPRSRFKSRSKPSRSPGTRTQNTRNGSRGRERQLSATIFGVSIVACALQANPGRTADAMRPSVRIFTDTV